MIAHQHLLDRTKLANQNLLGVTMCVWRKNKGGGAEGDEESRKGGRKEGRTRAGRDRSKARGK
jgi:hypothetical protein